MLVPWVWLWVLVCVAQCACGGSLRGAVEALQRRQRTPATDYDALYEFVPPGYNEPDYSVDVDYADQEPKYLIKILDENDRARPIDAYEYKVVKKNNLAHKTAGKQSAFREKSQRDNDKLKDLFTDNNDSEEIKEMAQAHANKETEYAILLNQLWKDYKNNKAYKPDSVSQGVVKIYKEKERKKRYPDNWGPIAFKRKRSSGSDVPPPSPQYYDTERKEGPDTNYNSYDVSDDDKDDWREEYAIAFQPLDEDSMIELGDENRYSIDSMEKRFPVTKRSSGSYKHIHQKRFLKNKSDKTKGFRSSSGTDPRIIKDLNKIFGESVAVIKTSVKRSTDFESHTHETKPPKVTVLSHNNTHEQANFTHYDVESHEQHQGHMHHPGHEGMTEIELSSSNKNDTHEQHQGHMHHPGHEGMKEIELSSSNKNDNNHNHDNHDKQIIVRKKSIDWSDYFGIDKRVQKFLNDGGQNLLRKHYFDTFNSEVIYPLKALRKHSFTKRNFGQAEPESESHGAHTSFNNQKGKQATNDGSKLGNLDETLKDMEETLVDEALHYSDSGEELDSTEEQEMKEKLLSQLAAAYSLEKMRKALKEFKQDLLTQKSPHPAPQPTDEMKVKRVAIKKELTNTDIPIFNQQSGKLDEFEEEQGAGHYLNGREQQFSEGYMGSGRHRYPGISTVGALGACPVLTNIVQHCSGVDFLAGDRGQFFLPLCSLHQICYLCGKVPQTTCDLIFLSEADTSCEGDMDCEQAARTALLALSDLHDNLADQLDGECEASPCLVKTLKQNLGWQRGLP